MITVWVKIFCALSGIKTYEVQNLLVLILLWKAISNHIQEVLICCNKTTAWRQLNT